MKTTLLLALLCLGSGVKGWAQAGLNTKDLEDISRERPFSAQNLNNATAAANAEATPLLPPEAYYDPSWRSGFLLTINHEKQPVSQARYNLRLRLLEVQDGAARGGVRVYPVGSVRGFVLGAADGQPAREFEVFRYYSHEGSRRGFFEVLNEGPLRLLLQYDFVDQTAVRNAALNLETRPAQQLRTTALFVSGPRRPEPVVELALERKAVLKLFGAEAPKLDEYATQHHLRYDQLPDMVELVKEYNKRTASTPAPGVH